MSDQIGSWWEESNLEQKPSTHIDLMTNAACSILNQVEVEKKIYQLPIILYHDIVVLIRAK